MSKSDHEASDARAQKRHPLTMKHTTPSILHEIITRVSESRRRTATPSGDLANAAQLACARWLSGYRASLHIGVRQLVERASISPQQLLWIDLGLASPDILKGEQETLLRAALMGEEDEDHQTLNNIIDIALGYTRQLDPGMLAWIIEDLEEDIWRQADVETVFAEYFSPASVVDVEKVWKTLRHDHLLVLDILALGDKSSQELKVETVRRRPAGQVGLDSSTYAAVIDALVTKDLIELLPDQWDASLQMELRHLRLTKFGRRVLLLQRYTTHQEMLRQWHFVQVIAAWLRKQGAMIGR